MAVGVIAVFSLVRKPAIRPNLRGPEQLLAGPQDDAHRFVVEDEGETGHACCVGKPLANPPASQDAVAYTVTISAWSERVTPTRYAPCRPDAAA